ncbi:MAG: radical SAM protein [SAR202 cluster bacterium]|nr:radical SAM protein [SAR202 cluster bacterium]
MKIGIIELLAGGSSPTWKQTVEDFLTTKQYASIMPQAVTVWARQLGHQVHYATFYGQGDPKRKLPADLDMVFMSVYTKDCALSYALAKLYQREGTVTVIGGPHAKSFPQDCLRFFDLVVTQCDQQLMADILGGHYEPNTIMASGRSLTTLPSVEERMPEVRSASFFQGTKPYFASMVPLLASLGCPYSCNFCTDWNNPYSVLSPDQLEADLKYLSANYPGVKIAFQDPNFAVQFDKTLDVLERIPQGQRNPYVMESSLSVLKGSRMERLRDTNCFFVAPGVESWTNYSNKAGVGTTTGVAKVHAVAEHLELLQSYVPALQVNLMFGLDTDIGNEPIELSKEFMSLTPFAWPVLNIPVPFGGTPLHDQYLEENRVLEAMPFSFYYFPYLVTTLKNYDPVSYYQGMLDMLLHYSNRRFLWQRLGTTSSQSLRLLHIVRTLRAKEGIGQFRRILNMLTTDKQFREFHEGGSTELPEFYHHEFERLLGRYATLISREERVPSLRAAVLA